MKKISLSLAKITRPQTGGLIPRKKLYHIFTGNRSIPATWIAGPAGSGKTALVSSYLEQSGKPHIWYRMDQTDNDITNFFYYMALAVNNSAQESKQLPIFMPEYSFDFRVFTKNFYDRICKKLTEDTLIVLDNYHDISRHASLHKVISETLSFGAGRIKFIIISRTPPPSIFARAIANNAMDFLTWKDLRFTEKETGEAIHATTDKKFPGDTIRKIYRKTDGWITGIRILSKNMDPGIPASQSLPGSIPDDISEYFSNQVFNHLDKPVQSFLLQTSFLPKMTSDMASGLTGANQAEKILNRLNLDNMFTEKQIDTKTYYHCNPLFSEFLKIKAENSLSSEKVFHIKRSAVTHLVSDGQIENAITILRQIKDYDKIISLIRAHAPYFISTERHETVEKWIRELPDAVVSEDPWLLYWLAVAVMNTDTKTSRLMFENACCLFKEKKDKKGVLLSTCGAFDAFSFKPELMKTFAPWLPQVDDLLNQLKTLDDPEIEAQIIASIYHFLIYYHPDTETLRMLETKARKRILSNIDAEKKIHLYLGIIGHKLLFGNPGESKIFMDQCHLLAKSGNTKPLLLLLLKSYEIYYFWITGELDRCMNTLSDLIEYANRTNIHYFTFFAMSIGCLCAFSFGETARGNTDVKSLKTFMDADSPLHRHLFHLVKLGQALVQKKYDQAIQHADLSMDAVHNASRLATAPAMHMGKALALNAMKNHTQAGQALDAAFQTNDKIRSRHVEYNLILAKIGFELDRSRETNALPMIQKFMTSGKNHRIYGTFFRQQTLMEKVCLHALKMGTEEKYAQAMIRKHNILPDNPPSAPENWPWAVKILTLGKFKLFINDEPYEFSGKVREKPLALLKALIIMGRKKVAAEYIQKMLWPDLDEKSLKNAFSTTLHRLRKILGYRRAVVFTDGKVFIDDRYCYVDVWRYEDRLNQARTMWEMLKDNNTIRRALGLTQQIMKEKNEIFLPGDVESWLIPYREHLKQTYLSCINHMGKYLEQKKQYTKAIYSYQKGLEIDPFMENFYKKIIFCYNTSGYTPEAFSTYQRYQKIFGDVNDIEKFPIPVCYSGCHKSVPIE